MTDINGYCPMGCGQTLIAIADEGGRIECSNIDCPNPYAVDQILNDPETEHIVTLRTDDFTIQHPLRERLDGDLERCSLHMRIAAMGGPPETPGRYRVTFEPGPVYTWTWTALPAVGGDH